MDVDVAGAGEPIMQRAPVSLFLRRYRIPASSASSVVRSCSRRTRARNASRFDVSDVQPVLIHFGIVPGAGSRSSHGWTKNTHGSAADWAIASSVFSTPYTFK